MIIDGIECEFNEWLSRWRDEALCQELDLIRIDKDKDIKAKQDQIDGNNLLETAHLVKLGGPENFLMWLGAIQTVIKKLPTGFDKAAVFNIVVPRIPPLPSPSNMIINKNACII